MTRPDRPEELIEHGQVTLRRLREQDPDAVFRAVTESADHLRPWMPWAVDYSSQSRVRRDRHRRGVATGR
jgi:hypothetical protein